MTNTLRALTALLLSAALLIAGNGLQVTLLAVRAEMESFPLALIGLLMSAYYVGFVSGCKFAPYLIRNVGHVRTFGALAALASATALTYALFVTPVLWLLLRAITGFALAGMYMIIEGWLNESVDNKSRGKLLSTYRVIDLVALTAGQALLTVAYPGNFDLFAVVSILMSLAIVPMALSSAPNPGTVKAVELNVAKVFRASPAAILGCLGAGMGNGAFWALSPVYVQLGGFDANTIAAFISAMIIGGALMQWPIGLVSDKIDRRIVIGVAALLCAIISLSIAALAPASRLLLLTSGFAFGLFAMPTYGLAVAHANDRAEPGAHISLNASLLFVFGLGAMIGPIIAAFAMQQSRAGLFVYIGAVYSALALATLYRIITKAKVKKQVKFMPMPRTSPELYRILPKRKRN